jgi:transcriptional regulator with XRE-family HTH domain
MENTHAPRIFLREWRQRRGLSQDDLAARLDTSKSVISQLETGKRRWNQDHLGELAFALGCDPADLLRPDPQPLEQLRLVWESIPTDQQAHALDVLRTFQRAGLVAAK